MHGTQPNELHMGLAGERFAFLISDGGEQDTAKKGQVKSLTVSPK